MWRVLGGRSQVPDVLEVVVLDLDVAVARVVLAQDVNHLRAVRNHQLLPDLHAVHLYSAPISYT